MQNAFASITIPKQSLRVSHTYKTQVEHLQFNRFLTIQQPASRAK